LDETADLVVDGLVEILDRRPGRMASERGPREDRMLRLRHMPQEMTGVVQLRKGDDGEIGVGAADQVQRQVSSHPDPGRRGLTDPRQGIRVVGIRRARKIAGIGMRRMCFDHLPDTVG
jgi:hypothetical protein